MAIRQVDFAIRLRQLQQINLIQRRLFTGHFHLYVSLDYVNKYGKHEFIADLKNRRIATFGIPLPIHLNELNWLETIGHFDGGERVLPSPCWPTMSSARMLGWCSCCPKPRRRPLTPISPVPIP